MKLYGFELHEPNYESAFVLYELYDSIERLRKELIKEGYKKIIPNNDEIQIIDETWIWNDDPDHPINHIRIQDLSKFKHGFIREFYYDASWRIAEH